MLAGKLCQDREIKFLKSGEGAERESIEKCTKRNTTMRIFFARERILFFKNNPHFENGRNGSC